MAGLLDMPMMSSYNASKAAVVSLSETLQNELAHSNIGVSVVCPAFFKTNLNESMRTPDERLRKAADKLLNSSKVTAEHIADQIFSAVEKKKFYVLPHTIARGLWEFKRRAPRALYSSIIVDRTRRLHKS